MGVPTVLMPHQFNMLRIVLVCHRIVKNQKPFRSLYNLRLNILPSQLWTKFFSIQITVESIMTKLLTVFSKIRQCLIDLTYQQVLAIIQTAYCLCSCSHTPKRTGFFPFRQLLRFA